MKAWLAIATMLVFHASSASAQQPAKPSTGSPVSRVQALFAAFNAHDPDAMVLHVSDDIQWFTVSGDQLSVETSGKPALLKGMKSYFASTPGVRSEIEGTTVSGSFVALREHVYWQSAQGEKSQASLAVYEVRDDKIRRVWYYPAEQ